VPAHIPQRSRIHILPDEFQITQCHNGAVVFMGQQTFQQAFSLCPPRGVKVQHAVHAPIFCQPDMGDIHDRAAGAVLHEEQRFLAPVTQRFKCRARSGGGAWQGCQLGLFQPAHTSR